MKEIGKMTINSEEDQKIIRMAIGMKDNILMGSRKELVLSLGRQVKFMKDSGKELLSMVQVCGKALMEIVTQENGIQDQLKDMEYTYR